MCTKVFIEVLIVGIRWSIELAWGCLIDSHGHFGSSEQDRSISFITSKALCILFQAEKRIRSNNIGSLQHLFKCFFSLFSFFGEGLAGVLDFISAVSAGMWGIVTIFTVSITLAKRQCIAFQPDAFHICIDLKPHSLAMRQKYATSA